MFLMMSTEELLAASASHIFHFTYITPNHLVRSLSVTNTPVRLRTDVAACRADSKPTEILFSRPDTKREDLVLDAVVSQVSLVSDRVFPLAPSLWTYCTKIFMPG